MGQCYKGVAKRIRVTHNGVVHEFNVSLCTSGGMYNAGGRCGNVYRARKSKQNTLNACLVYEKVRKDLSKRYEILCDMGNGYENIKPKKVEVVKYNIL